MLEEPNLFTVNFDCKGTSENLQFLVAESIKSAQNEISPYLLFEMHVIDLTLNNLSVYVSLLV